MAYDKEKYEKLICDSPLFNIDREKQRQGYRKESLKLIEYLYCYLMGINSDKYEPYGYEIVEVAKRCIKSFNGQGEFLHYFNAAWKNEFMHISGEMAVENKFRGVKLTEQEKRDIKKYMKIVSRCNDNLPLEQKYKKIAELMGISVEKIKDICEIAESKVVSEYCSNTDNEIVNIIENMSDDFSIEAYFDSLSSLVELLERVEDVFLNLQERQKPIVADMMTIKIGLDIPEINKLAKKYTFISDDISEYIIKTGKIPTQRDIAGKYGKNEASISRTMKEFLNKVREGEM